MPKQPLSHAVALSALAALAIAPGAALAEPWCDFLSAVLADKETGFASLRGPIDEKLSEKDKGKFVCEGALTPQPGATCETGPASVNSPSYYRCDIRKEIPGFAQGEALYGELSGKMQRCYPTARFEESRAAPKSEASNGYGGIGTSGLVEGYKLSLELSNLHSVVQRMMEGRFHGTATTPMTYKISISVSAP